MATRGLTPPRFTMTNIAHKLAAAMVAASVLCAILGRTGLEYLLFTPAFVIERWFVWQPFTTLLIATSPVEVIFSFIILYSCGTNLLQWWGEKQFLKMVLGISLAGMFVTLLLSFFFSGLSINTYPGATCVVTVVWIAFGLVAWMSGQMLNFWGIPLTGLNFAYTGLGFVLLNGVFNGFARVLPELIAAGLTFLYFQKRVDKEKEQSLWQRVELYYYNWKLKRLKAKRGFQVIEGEGKKSTTDRQIH